MSTSFPPLPAVFCGRSFLPVPSDTPQCNSANGRFRSVTAGKAKRPGKEAGPWESGPLERTRTEEDQNGTGERKDESPPRHVERFQEQLTERHEQHRQDKGVKRAQDDELAEEFRFSQLKRCAVVFVPRAVIVD
jgi:hypothetical protein